MENILIVAQGVLNELRIDFQEVIGDIFEQFGIDDIWERIGHTTNQIGLILFSTNGQVGSRRSIVRRIGVQIPFKPVRRPYLRLVKNGTRLVKERRALFDEPQFSRSEDAAYVYTIDYQKDSMSPGLNRCSSMLNDTVINLHDPSITSTPKRSRSSNSSPVSTLYYSDTNEATALKMTNIQEELQLLQSQFAVFIAQRESIPLPTMSLCPNVCVNRPPPPPPPPLPLTPIYISGSKNRINMEKRSQFKRGRQSSANGSLNMIEILKDLSSVKLKHVERSPGGTPLRRKPRTPDRHDTGAIMSAALKKRFAHLETLQENKENEYYDNESSWDCDSPCSSPMIKIY